MSFSTKATHTPGPWIAEGRQVKTLNQHGKFNCYTATCAYYGENEKDKPNKAQAEANAHLIAAAPKLLAFAESYMAMANEVTNRGTSARPTVAQLNALFEQARAAIAKVEARK